MSIFQDVYICNQERTQRLNDRIYERNLPSQDMQMTFDPRPVRTRQVLFPMLDCYMPSTTPIIERSTYTQDQVFNPGTSAPFNGYQSGIDSESQLQNRFFPHQKAIQSKYIPSTHSNMYQHQITSADSQPIHQYEVAQDPYMDLYTSAEHHARETYGHPHPNPHKEVGGDLFYNHTKVQVKNINQMCPSR